MSSEDRTVTSCFVGPPATTADLEPTLSGSEQKEQARLARLARFGSS